MSETIETFYIEDEHGNKTPLDRMTRAQCEAVIEAMAEELAYWRRLDAIVHAAMECEDLRAEAKH